MLSLFLSLTARARMGCLAASLVFLLTPSLYAQSKDQASEAINPVPVFSAGIAFVSVFQGGTPNLDPLVAPVVLIPLGQNWLIESRGEFQSDLVPDRHGPGWKGSLQSELDYLQVDYIANPYLTVTVGRYLTPFGIFNERLYPVWIRNLQSDPLILPIATGPSNAGTGVMFRGGFNATPRMEVNYAAYFSAKSTVSPIDSDRDIGARAGVFLPGPRLEVGASFQHLLQDDHSNAFGFHFEWQPPPLPLDIRAEYARSQIGSGYWIESAYRLSQIPVWRNEFRRFQVVGRMQQFYARKDDDGMTAVSTGLPAVNTNLFEFGVNYYFRDDIRFVSSYGRQFAPEAGNENVWTVGLTYRVAVPLGHGNIQQ
jgi:hypothetical protein